MAIDVANAFLVQYSTPSTNQPCISFPCLDFKVMVFGDATGGMKL
jgi:hypothetical protein